MYRPREVLGSSQIAFFLGSVVSVPAAVEWRVEGAVWRMPGPSLRGFLEVGREDGGMVSPGRRMSIVDVVSVVQWLLQIVG